MGAKNKDRGARNAVRNKIREVMNEAEHEMLMTTGERGAVASGRFAACKALLDGMSIEMMEAGIPALNGTHARAGWIEIVKQFKGLV